jgi:hypothetical protein
VYDATSIALAHFDSASVSGNNSSANFLLTIDLLGLMPGAHAVTVAVVRAGGSALTDTDADADADGTDGSNVQQGQGQGQGQGQKQRGKGAAVVVYSDAVRFYVDEAKA